jgi:hypothetical protein
MEEIAAEMKSKMEKQIERMFDMVMPSCDPIIKTVYLSIKGDRYSYDFLRKCLLRVYTKPIERENRTFLVNLGTKEEHGAVDKFDNEFFVITMFRSSDCIASEALKAPEIPPAVIEEARKLKPGQSITLNAEIVCDSDWLPFSADDLCDALTDADLAHIAFFGAKEHNRSASLTLLYPRRD